MPKGLDEAAQKAFYNDQKAKLRRALSTWKQKGTQGDYLWLDMDGRKIVIPNNKESIKQAHKAIFDHLKKVEETKNTKKVITLPTEVSKLAASDGVPNNVSFKLLDDMSEKQRYINPQAGRIGLNKALGIDNNLESRIIYDITRGKKSQWSKLDAREQHMYNDMVTEIKREAVYGSSGGYDFPEFNIGKFEQLWGRKKGGVGKWFQGIKPVNRTMNLLDKTPLKTSENVHGKLSGANRAYREELFGRAQEVEEVLKANYKNMRKESGEVVSNILEGNLDNNTVKLFNGKVVEATPVEHKLADWLRKKYRDTNLIDTKYKIDNYNPRISQHFDDEIINIAEIEQSAKRQVHFFAEKQRETDRVGSIRDAFELYRMYVGKGLRKKHFQKAITEINEHLDITRKKYPEIADSYETMVRYNMNRFLGIPSQADFTVAQNIGNFGRMFGIDFDNAQIIDFGRKILDTVYMNGLSRPTLAVRNLFQSMLTAADQGNIATAAGLKRTITGGKKYYKMLEEKQVFSNLHNEWMREYQKATGRGYSKYLDSAWDKSKNAAMFLFDSSDKMNRMIAYGAGEYNITNKIQKYGANSKQVQKLLKKIDPTYRREVQNHLLKGRVEDAIHQYAKRVSDRTQFMYSSEGSPLMTAGVAGKFAGQFLTWTGNYAGLVKEWGLKNPALYRHAANSFAMMQILPALGVSPDLIPFHEPFMRLGQKGLGALQSPATSTLQDVLGSAVGIAESIEQGSWKPFATKASKLMTHDLPMFVPFTFVPRAGADLYKVGTGEKDFLELFIKPAKKEKPKKTTIGRKKRAKRSGRKKVTIGER
jgi:hypothetical protein